MQGGGCLDIIDLMKSLNIDVIDGRYEIVDALSEGKGSRSFKGIDKNTSDAVFMKYLLFPSCQYEISKFKSEIRVVKDITLREEGGPGCICAKFLHAETISEGNIYCLITEWCDAPTLESWLLNNTDSSVDERLELVHRICSAVGKIPSGYHHRDLHPGNILVEDIEVDWFCITSNVGIKIVDWGDAIPEGLYGYEDTPDYVIDLVKNSPKKIEGSYYSLPPEIFTPWAERKTQWGKYDAWPIALLMFKIMTGYDMIEHDDLGSYIKSVHSFGLINTLITTKALLTNLEFDGKFLLIDAFSKIAEPDCRKRETLSYISRVIWDIRIEKFTPDDPSIRYQYLQDPFNYTPEHGWSFSSMPDYY